jgi:hypothetical protein
MSNKNETFLAVKFIESPSKFYAEFGTCKFFKKEKIIKKKIMILSLILRFYKFLSI